MASTFDTLLNAKGVLLADGATGTTLFDMGLVSGDAPELWNDIHPDRIETLHQGFVDAGADIILTNTFGCNARRLMLHQLEGRTRELNRLGAEIGRKVADAAGRPVIVAGSVGPTGDLFAPLGPLTEEEAVEVFVDQMEGLKDGGADIAGIETMSAFEEIRAALEAARRVDFPAAVTASFDTAGRTMMGLTPAALIEQLRESGFAPAAIGSNCGVGASDLLAGTIEMTATDPDVIIVAKANCGIPVVEGEHVNYTGTPELMADYARLAIDAGARVIGGCCGTSATHLKAMRDAIDSHEKGEKPDIDRIVSLCGPLTSPPAKPDADGGGRRERRRRRGG